MTDIHPEVEPDGPARGAQDVSDALDRLLDLLAAEVAERLRCENNNGVEPHKLKGKP